MRVIAHRPLDKLDATPALGEFIYQEHLMHRVTSQPIRGGEYDTCKGCRGDAVSETIETGALERGTTVAIITVDVLITDMPIGLGRNRGMETAELLIDRLVLLLTGR